MEIKEQLRSLIVAQGVRIKEQEFSNAEIDKYSTLYKLLIEHDKIENDANKTSTQLEIEEGKIKAQLEIEKNKIENDANKTEAQLRIEEEKIKAQLEIEKNKIENDANKTEAQLRIEEEKIKAQSKIEENKLKVQSIIEHDKLRESRFALYVNSGAAIGSFIVGEVIKITLVKAGFTFETTNTVTSSFLKPMINRLIK